MRTLQVGLLAALIAIAIAVNLPGVPTEFSQDKQVMSAIVDDVANRFEEEYMAFLKTGVESAALKQLTVQLANCHTKKDIFTKELTELEPRDHFAICALCRSIVRVLIRMAREEDGELNGPNREKILKDIAYDVCRRLNLQTEEVCGGLIDSNYETMIYIVDNSEIDSRSFCGLFMEFGFCGTESKNPDYNWTLPVDQSETQLTGPKKNAPKYSKDKDLLVCHITDMHLDILYEPGSLAECDEPLCCQRGKDTHQGTSKAAGHWGDYRECDLPWHSFEDALQQIVKNHKCDIVIQTGDVIDHMVWATSLEKNTEVLTRFNKRLAEVFGDIPVYSCLGNHEPHPLNLFSPADVPAEVSTKWLYEQLYKDWSKWLPAETKETFTKGGYYTLLARKGLRIIALNSNDCYSSNWWLFYSGKNKQEQLQWLHDTLLQAEKNNEYVYILSHIPPGDGTCWYIWAAQLNRIVERFSNTISAIFNGHSHQDELLVHYSSKGDPVAVTWNGGALTTFSYKNPNYKVYSVNQDNYQVTNHHTYIYNLTEANLHPDKNPEWYLEYEFIKEFTDDLSPYGIDQLLEQFADNPNLLRKYWKYMRTSASPRLDAGCDRWCLQGTLCRAAVTVNKETKRCEQLRERLYAALDKEDESTTQTPTGPTPTDPTKPTEKPDDEDDGAASLAAFSITSFIALILAMMYIV